MEKLTKKELAEKLGVSRPTLDTYLKNGFPKKITETIAEQDVGYRKLMLENEIRLLEYQLAKLKEELEQIGE